MTRLDPLRVVDRAVDATPLVIVSGDDRAERDRRFADRANHEPSRSCRPPVKKFTDTVRRLSELNHDQTLSNPSGSADRAAARQAIVER